MCYFSRFSKKYILFHVGFIMRYNGGNNMERKTLGILALALSGLFAVSMVAAMPFGNAEDKDAIRDAVEAGDYDTWKSLMTAELSEENFDKMTQMHELRFEIQEAREAEEMDDAKESMDEMKELMPERRMGHGKGLGQGFGRGMDRGHGECPFAN